MLKYTVTNEATEQVWEFDEYLDAINYVGYLVATTNYTTQAFIIGCKKV